MASEGVWEHTSGNCSTSLIILLSPLALGGEWGAGTTSEEGVRWAVGEAAFPCCAKMARGGVVPLALVVADSSLLLKRGSFACPP